MSLIGKRKSKSKLLGEPKIEVVSEGSTATPGTPTSSTSVSDDYGKLLMSIIQLFKWIISSFGGSKMPTHNSMNYTEIA